MNPLGIDPFEPARDPALNSTSHSCWTCMASGAPKRFDQMDANEWAAYTTSTRDLTAAVAERRVALRALNAAVRGNPKLASKGDIERAAFVDSELAKLIADLNRADRRLSYIEDWMCAQGWMSDDARSPGLNSFEPLPADPE